jgi:riboflavin kinase/FMN adenylyltransferase
MRVLENLDHRPEFLTTSAVTIGKFFAAHIGHQALIRATREAAARREAASVVITFDRHPMELLRPGTSFPQLTTLEERLELIGGLGADYAVLVRLDLEFLSQTPETFVRTMLIDRLAAVEVVTSDNFRFGRGAAGTVETLQSLGEREGFGVTVVPPVLVGGEPVSSSRIAACIGEGRVEAATEMLGRLYHVSGPVVAGDGRGRQIGFPTANVSVDARRLLPADGVYSCFAVHGTRRDLAVINIGVRPTVGGTRRQVEAHLLDFCADLYGAQLTLEFQRRLRDEQRFPSIDALREQIARDVASARALACRQG